MCAKHQADHEQNKPKKKQEKKKTYKISKIDPIFQYRLSDVLMEETLDLRKLFVPTTSRRYRAADYMADRPEALKSAKAYCERVIAHLKQLPGSVIQGAKAKRYDLYQPAFIHAPPNTTTAGTTHVDMEYFPHHTLYTVWIPIDEVTEDNGCVTMFLKSQGTPIDYRRKNQHKKFKKKRILKGELGDIFIFDGRLHHRSEANTTDAIRSVFTFGLLKKGFAVQDLKR